MISATEVSDAMLERAQRAMDHAFGACASCSLPGEEKREGNARKFPIGLIYVYNTRTHIYKPDPRLIEASAWPWLIDG
jgi:hypothetical protein